MSKQFRTIGVIVLTLVVNFCLLWSISVASSLTGCGGEVIGASNGQFEQQVVELVNQVRAEQSLPPLKLNPDLANAARYLAQDMAEDDYFAHDTHDRQDDQLVRVCKWVERIQQYYPTPSAENVAAGYASPAAVVQGWIESEGHRKNILNDNQEMGVGYYDGYWVQDFGKRSEHFPLIINGEAITSASLEVNLYIYGAWDNIRLRNNGGEWTEWQPFQNQMTWRLDAVSGVQIVDVEMQNTLTTASSRDEIEVRNEEFTAKAKILEVSRSMLFLPVLQH